MFSLSRENKQVTRALLDEQDDLRWRSRSDQLSMRRAFAQENQRRLTIQDLLEYQERLRLRRLELLNASMVVECEKALKSWDTEDLGQGHPPWRHKTTR